MPPFQVKYPVACGIASLGYDHMELLGMLTFFTELPFALAINFHEESNFLLQQICKKSAYLMTPESNTAYF